MRPTLSQQRLNNLVRNIHRLHTHMVRMRKVDELSAPDRRPRRLEIGGTELGIESVEEKEETVAEGDDVVLGFWEGWEVWEVEDVVIFGERW